MVNFPQVLWATRTSDGGTPASASGGVASSSQYIDSLHPIVEKYHRQIPDFTAIQMREILFKDPQGMLTSRFQSSKMQDFSQSREIITPDKSFLEIRN